MKELKTVDDLAISGALPMFAEPLFVGRPNVGSRQALLQRIGEVLDRRWFTNNGPLVQEFEEKLKEFLGVRNCVPICNGTVALEIAIRALELKEEIILPSFTFVATAHALQWLGITPVFCDIDPHTHNLDPDRLEELITPRTTGIIGVHVWGRPCDVERLQAIADRHGLVLMFDAAHAFACSCQGRMIGNFGRCEIFSFHTTKFFNSFEGGAIATNDDKLAARIRLMKTFGFSGYDNVICLGTNGKMTEVCAAMGLTGLECLGGNIDVNRRNYRYYCEKFRNIPGIRMVQYNEKEQCNFQYIVLEIGDEFGVSRDDLVRILHAENVIARRYFFPGCHRMEPYLTLSPMVGQRLPVTNVVCEQVLVLPTGAAVTEDDVEGVVAIIKMVFAHKTRIKDLL